MRSIFSWAREARPFPYPKRTAGSAMAWLFVTGGLTTLLVGLLPHPSTMRENVVFVLGGASPVVAVMIHLMRDRLPGWVYPWLLTMGTCIVTSLVAAGGAGSVSVAFSFLYIWVVMYALLFFRPIVAGVQVVVAVAAYILVLVWSGAFTSGHLTAVEPVLLMVVIATTSVVLLAMSHSRETTEVDPLTLVANRRGLERILDQEMQEALLDGQPLVIAMIDVDHFKQINDQYGHHVGDLVLQRLAREWHAMLRAGDALGRFGGDEFVVVLPRCPPPAVGPILERLRGVVAGGVTCSVGGALWRPGDSASMLMSHADSALYEAKRLGRDRIAWADDVASVPGAAGELSFQSES
ncbi:MAG: GGDEF domain-containing protein [Nocardioidaceae bacterium]